MWLLERWRRALAERTERVEADASALIEEFGDEAYDVARERVRREREAPPSRDAARPRGHWTQVKLRIGALTGRGAEADTSTRMAARRDA